jgi:hypothetical protein
MFALPDCEREWGTAATHLIRVGVDGPTASGARLGLSLTKTGAVHVRD